MSVVTLPEVVFGAKVQELQSHLGLVAQVTGDRKVEADRLLKKGNQLSKTSRYQDALQVWEQALQIYREIKDLHGEGNSLNNIGIAYKNLRQYQQAINYYQKSLAIASQINDLKMKRQLLIDLSVSHRSLGLNQQETDYLQQSLAIDKEIGKRKKEGEFFNNISNLYYSAGLYQRALEGSQASLIIARQIGDLKLQGASLLLLGDISLSLEKPQKAIDYYQQTLEIANELKILEWEGRALEGIGNVHMLLQQYQKTIDYFQKSLAIAKQINARKAEIVLINKLGIAYYSLGYYQKAIYYHDQSLSIARENKDLKDEGTSLNNISNVYYSLGYYQKAIDYQQQHLSITKELKDRSAEGASLSGLGNIYRALKQYQKAISYHQKSLEIAKELKDIRAEAISLVNLGNAYQFAGDYQKALVYYQQCLVVSKQISDFSGMGELLSGLGNVYELLGQYKQAMMFYGKSLVHFQRIGDRNNEGGLLYNLGRIFSQLNQPILATIFYKKSVNVSESIRKYIRELSKEEQKFYLDTVQDRYRALANLLLKQDRIMEALQVLDLLKVQELQDFLKDVKGNEITSQGIELLTEEKEFWQKFDSHNGELKVESVQYTIQQLRQTAPAQNIKLAAYKDLQTRLQKLGSNSALLYPLILEDRLELVLFVPNAPPISRTVKVKQTELIKVAEQFREDIQKPNSLAVLDPANKLYNWMIEPIANDLKQANITTIIYAPDGVMRHVPLAALYDGKQWLVEKYRINYITALSLTNIDPQTQQAPRILAGAFTDRSGTVKIGDNNISFSSLPAALPEVENLVTNFPNTTKLVDKDFNRKAIESDKLNQYNIIHFATHAHLVAGSPEDSFVLLNNNEYVTLRQVKDWKLPNVGLAVFSACQTALGGKLSSGIEIIGFGYQLQQAQARASIATLWEISDGGTQALMGKFYERMKLTSSSAEALQQAQIDLIRSNGKSTDEKRAGVRITWQGIKPEVESQLNHPYYWAPFILIGNGF
jgi:CHAT domain-containing protein